MYKEDDVCKRDSPIYTRRRVSPSRTRVVKPVYPEKRHLVRPALYPESYDHPRLWNKVPWPERHVAFDKWFDRTELCRLTGGEASE